MHEILVIVSIDTEEDAWRPRPWRATLENIRELGRLGAFFQRLGVRPTYFTTYQVAREPWASRLVREASEASRGEIGAHLHPWNTPPLGEAFTSRNSMLSNLPAELQLAKLEELTAALVAAFGTVPRAFRAGRYALGRDTVAALVRCGYRVDSSVTPFVNWELIDDGPTFFGAPIGPYRMAPDGDVRQPVPDGALLEIPLSCGFRRGPVALWDPARRFFDAAPLRRLRLAGQATLTALLKRTILSPELASAGEMLALSRRLLQRGVRYLHMSWHSSTLVPGLSPYAATASDVDRLYASVEDYLEALSRLTPLRFATVSEAAASLGD